MPIGKNAIKRISNNGYSNVTTSAPDMENSVVNEEKEIAPKKEAKKTSANAENAKKTAPVAKKSPKAGTKKAPSAKASTKAPTKKSAPKSAPKSTTLPKKSMETEPALSPVNTAKKVTGKTENKQDNGCIHIGGELPIHLL